MFIAMQQNNGNFAAGEVYEISEAEAWGMRTGGVKFRITAQPADWINRFYDKLKLGAGESCIFLPFLGEFGHFVMSQVRLVHFHQAKYKIVCCQRGEEVLFPSANAFYSGWENPFEDAKRAGTMRHHNIQWPKLKELFPSPNVAISSTSLGPTHDLFPYFPEHKIPFSPCRIGISADVVLGVRRRQFCKERDWSHWLEVGAALHARGISFAVIGRPDTTEFIPGAKFQANGDLDNAIELLKSCKLYVGTDTGQSHLAAECQSKMLVFRHDGERKYFNRMARVNRNSLRVVEDGWEHPEFVVRAILHALEGSE